MSGNVNSCVPEFVWHGCKNTFRAGIQHQFPRGRVLQAAGTKPEEEYRTKQGAKCTTKGLANYTKRRKIKPILTGMFEKAILFIDETGFKS
jgi:hypothetical protein